MKNVYSLLVALSLSGCQTLDPLSGENDPKYWWSLEFTAPIYMTGWVESSMVEDVQGQIIDHGTGGIIGAARVPLGLESEKARGWPRALAGGIRGVVGADLPRRVFVRWQSIVEKKTYRTWIDIPDEARAIMYTSTHRRCPATPERPALYRATMHVGMAPGGAVQVWVRDRCDKPIPVAHTQAELEPLGPSQGKMGGRYAYETSEYTQRYIDKYGIPYGSW